MYSIVGKFLSVVLISTCIVCCSCTPSEKSNGATNPENIEKSRVFRHSSGAYYTIGDFKIAITDGNKFRGLEIDSGEYTHVDVHINDSFNLEVAKKISEVAPKCFWLEINSLDYDEASQKSLPGDPPTGDVLTFLLETLPIEFVGLVGSGMTDDSLRAIFSTKDLKLVELALIGSTTRILDNVESEKTVDVLVFSSCDESEGKPDYLRILTAISKVRVKHITVMDVGQIRPTHLAVLLSHTGVDSLMFGNIDDVESFSAFNNVEHSVVSLDFVAKVRNEGELADILMCNTIKRIGHVSKEVADYINEKRPDIEVSTENLE